jgi:hypothetical protein
MGYTGRTLLSFVNLLALSPETRMQTVLHSTVRAA